MYRFFHSESYNIIFFSSGMAIICAFRPFIRRLTLGQMNPLKKNQSYDFLNMFILKLDDSHHHIYLVAYSYEASSWTFYCSL